MPDSTARLWRALLFLGVDFLPERLRRGANQFARGASLWEKPATFKRADMALSESDTVPVVSLPEFCFQQCAPRRWSWVR